VTWLGSFGPFADRDGVCCDLSLPSPAGQSPQARPSQAFIEIVRFSRFVLPTL